MDVWGLVKKVTVKHLAIYLGAAFVADRIIMYVGDLWVDTQTTERGILSSLSLVWDIGYWIEISMMVAFLWLIVRVFVEIRQG